MVHVAVAPFDPNRADGDVLEQVHRLGLLCHDEANRSEPHRSLEETKAFLRYPPAGEPRWHWVAVKDGEVVGFAQLAAAERSVVGNVTILVHPQARRHGVGHALFDLVARQAARADRRTLVGHHATTAGAAFAASLGAVDTRRDVRSILRLAEANLEVQPVPGYALESWNGRTPDELVQSFAAARVAINDAPSASDDEWHAWDVELIRDLERVVEQRRRQIRVTVALDRSRKVVAFTELRVSYARGAVATTEDTAVLPAHRRRGLARWVKAGALQQLREDRPDVTVVGTTNAEANTGMRAVNDRLGFVRASVSTACSLDLFAPAIP